MRVSAVAACDWPDPGRNVLYSDELLQSEVFEMARFRVALSSDVRHKGNPVFDLSGLTADPEIEIGFVEPENGTMPASMLGSGRADPAVSAALL